MLAELPPPTSTPVGQVASKSEPLSEPEIVVSRINDICSIIRNLLARCNIQYFVTPFDRSFYQCCCDEAVRRGYPMEGEHSLLPHIPGGVVMATNAYAHLPNRNTQIYIALYTAFLIYTDDIFNKNVDQVDLFNERFMLGKLQGNKTLDGFAQLLRETPKHFSRFVSNLIIISTLNLVSALLLEKETQGMPLSPRATGFPTFSRVMSGASEAYALFMFPPEIPLQHYIQSLPELMAHINCGNDVLSFYKEDLAGETVNRISTLAECCGVSKMEVVRHLADDAAESNFKICEILSPHPDAYKAYIKFRKGYVGFHTSLSRYRLHELFRGSD